MACGIQGEADVVLGLTARGLGSLTMRRLADRLHVEPMSLYYHVAGKDEIFDGMVDLVFAEVELPPAAAGWKTAMRDRAASARAALRRHPWATGLMDSRLNAGRVRAPSRSYGPSDQAGHLADRKLST